VPNPTPLRQPVAPYNRNCGLAFGKRTASSMFLNRWRAEISGSWPNQADCGIQLWFPCGWLPDRWWWNILSPLKMENVCS